MYSYVPDTQERCIKGDGGPDDGTEMNKDGSCERQQTWEVGIQERWKHYNQRKSSGSGQS